MTLTLAVDAGNTQLTWGLFRGPELRAVGSYGNAEERWSLPHPSWSGVERVSLASVRSGTADRWRAEWSDSPPVIELGVDRTIPVVTTVPHPEQVGADRLANCLGWAKRGQRQAPSVIVDFGTAITFDVVSADGDYLGGLILPGPKMVAGVLATGTSLLPEVTIDLTPELYGRDTLSCIRRGVYGLFRGGVEFHLRAFKQQLPAETVFVATGGGAPRYAPWFDSLELVLPYLTLEGIRWAEELSR